MLPSLTTGGDKTISINSSIISRIKLLVMAQMMAATCIGHQVAHKFRLFGFQLLGKFIPHFHQDSSEAVFPEPVLGKGCVGMILVQPYAPDSVVGAGFHEDFASSLEESFFKFWVL